MLHLPSGTVAFLFTDVVGSTRLWRDHEAAMHRAYLRHDALLRIAITRHGGVAFKTIGDAIQAAFPTVPDAVAGACEAQRGLAVEDWSAVGLPEPLRVRMALHVGAVNPDEHGDYRSPVLNRLGRLLSAAHGGQVLLSQAAFELVRDYLPEGAGLRDLGEQRLKDLGRPERVWQLMHPALPADFPPLATLASTPNNLPAQPTALIGRERDLSAVRAPLEGDDVRLVTLTGPGGVGKTRLALQVAADLLDHFPDGAWFVDVSAVTDPDRVPAAVASALQVPEEGGRTLTDVLSSYLRERRLLLVLDNLEHVMEAAPFVAGLLAAAPDLAILATSRSRLGLRGEREIVVPPLSMPDLRRPEPPGRLTQYDAVRLFVERAQAAKSGFAIDNATAPAVAEICHRLDGLPLAIELAAARVKLFPPAALLKQLERRLPFLTGGARDLPVRQRTLRDAIAWSYELLTAEEQKLFRRFGVFVGGFDLSAAAAVADPDGVLDVLAGVASLVDQSLLRRLEGPEELDDEPRFALLETVREFAAEQLKLAGEAAVVRRRHADHYLAVARELRAAQRAPDPAPALARARRNRANLGAALDHLIGQEDAGAALELVGAVWRFWYVAGAYAEGLVALERALACPGKAAPIVRADALNGFGAIAAAVGRLDEAVTAYDEARALWERSGDARGVAGTAINRALVIKQWGRHAEAAADLEQAARLFAELGDDWAAAAAWDNLGMVRLEMGDAVRAAELHARALALRRALGDAASIADSLHHLASAEVELGQLDEALTHAEAAREARERLEDRSGLAFNLNTLGYILDRRGEHAAADEHYRRALELWRELGQPHRVALALHNLAASAFRRGEMAAGLTHLHESLAIRRRLANPVDLLHTLRGFAEAARLGGQVDLAIRLVAAAEAYRVEAGVFVPPLDDDLAEIRQAIGPARFEAAWAAGAALSLDQALDLAATLSVKGIGAGGEGRPHP